MGETMTAFLMAMDQMADPFRLLMLSMGVMLGLILGIIPGLGGLVGLTLVLPFTFHMDPYTAMAVLIGMHAVVATSDSIPAILFGVPGTVGSAATVLDGYPMAKRGEAGRALGAAFFASMMGGLFGAFLLAMMIPVLRPLMLSIGSPEMLAFCVFGLSLAAALSGKHMLRGLAVACLGIILAMVGEDYQSGRLRWTYGELYLWDGIPLVPIALGLFAIPEIADLVVRRTRIAGDSSAAAKGQMQGVKDVLKNPIIALRSAAIGSLLGAMPGLGSSVIDWIAYGSAARITARKGDGPGFGNGDVRGVIASEAANNAKEGGALVPTLAFGVPGSAGMAILLGAFLVQGIIPGPDMLSRNLDITYTLIISLVAANVLGAMVCFAFAGQLAKIAMIPIGILAPVVLGIVFVGAFQGDHHWGDLIVLLGAGVLGYIMRAMSWPRPPLLLGFVLGALIERYLATSVQIYGASFLTRPVVLVVLVITAWGLLSPLWMAAWRRWQGRRSGAKLKIGFRADRLNWDTLFGVFMAGLFVFVIVDVDGWPRGARLVPQIVAWVGLIIMTAYVLGRLFLTIAESGGQHLDLAMDRTGMSQRQFVLRSFGYFGWLFGYGALAYVIGPIPAIGIWVASFMALGFGTSWIVSILFGGFLTAAVYGVFVELLNITWPRPIFPLF